MLCDFERWFDAITSRGLQTTATKKDSLQLSIPADGGWCVRVPGSCFLICCAPGGGKLNCGINEDLLGSE